MKRTALALALAMAAPLAHAQTIADASGAKLRFLDRLSGAVEDLVLARGESSVVGRLNVRMDQCRYDQENPGAEAFVHLTITAEPDGARIFDGWMVASSPAISALDHPRYDVWVLRCDVPDLELPEVEPAPEDGGQGEGGGQGEDDVQGEDGATDDGNG